SGGVVDDLGRPGPSSGRSHGSFLPTGIAHEHRVFFSRSRQAIELAATWNPDVVFLDLGLPGMDGYEVARQLRRLPGIRKVLVIAITGFRGAAVVQRCGEAGIDYHFPKPTDLDELERLLGLFARAAAFASGS